MARLIFVGLAVLTFLWLLDIVLSWRERRQFTRSNQTQKARKS